MMMKRQALSILEVSQLIGISRTKAYQAAKNGDLPTIKLGKRILVPVAALEQMLSEVQPKAAND